MDAIKEGMLASAKAAEAAVRLGERLLGQNTPKESEKTLEARLVREIEARGGMALKYTSQYHRGIPDRICLLPGGVCIFVELKSTGQKPTKLQDHAMKQLEKLGFSTRVIDSTESLDRLLWILDSAEKLRKIIHSQHLQDLPKTDKKLM